MSIIEEIKRDVRHDDECPARSGSVNSVRGILCNDYVPPECNCSRRRKIAWLERKSLTLDESLKFILGFPLFRAGRVARDLRAIGHDIPTKAEEEQAHVIHWMLMLYLEHGDRWSAVGSEELRKVKDKLKAAEEDLP